VSDSKKASIKVTVNITYVESQSTPQNNEYVFAYTVKITNVGNVAAQLIIRHWIITDEHNSAKEIKGLGVIGKQPLLAPSESFEYTSGTMINTPNGQMHGTYHFVTEDAAWFEVAIEPFMLISDRILH
jgi:ApaG protein